MVTARSTQLQAFSLLLALTALAVPVAGAIRFSDPELGSASVLLGGSARWEPITLLVGALALLVAPPRSATDRRATPLLAAGTIIAAGATLALAYGGSAVQLRPGGAFGLDAGGGAATWDLSRSSTVGSLALTAVVCMVVAVYAARWISEQEPRT